MAPENLLRNGDFEDGWYHAWGIAELQIPNDWTFWHATESDPNPHDPTPFVRPEVRVLPRNQLPDHERDVFILQGDHCLKVFKGYGAWWASFSQIHVLDPGHFRLQINVYGDLVDHYDGATKVPAPDPLSGQIRIFAGAKTSPWLPIPALKYAGFLFDFTVSDPDSEIALGVQFMCPFPLNNSGLFCDDWRLTQISEPGPDPEPDPPATGQEFDRVYRLLPQDATPGEVSGVVDLAYPDKNTVGFSIHDAVLSHPDIKTRTVHVYDVDRLMDGGRDAFETFVVDTYPPMPAIVYHSLGAAPDPDPDPDPDPEPEPKRWLVSLHLQTEVEGWRDFVRESRPPWVKLVGNAQLASVIKGLSPDTRVLYRHHLENQHQAPFLDGVPAVEAARLADLYWDDVENNPIDCVEGLNETIATGDVPGIQKAVAFAAAFSDEVKARGLDVKACVLNTAIGNPDHGEETRLLIPAARAVVDNDHFLGYHSYFPIHPIYAEKWMEEEGYHHHMRALESWLPTFQAEGLTPRFLFTEFGGCVCSARLPDLRPGIYDPGNGWEAGNGLAGDWPRYETLILRAVDMFQPYAVDGAFIFTIGQYWVGWDSFKLWETHMASLANAGVTVYGQGMT